MSVLLKDGQFYEGGQLVTKDVLVGDDGHIAGVGQNLAAQGAEVVDAAGKILSPGFCDLHVHLRQPGFEDKETIATGTKAAAAGGFTTVCSMPNLNPVPDELHSLQPQLDAIAKDAAVRVLPYGALTVGEKGGCPADISVLADFVCGFTDDGRGVQSGEMMRRVMALVAAARSFVAAHCEDETQIEKGAVTVQEGCRFAQQHGYTGVSSKSEWAEVERDIALARQTGCRLHICHASTAKTFALVRGAKAEGLPVTCEVTPHNLLLCCDDITEDDGRFKMNPPLRTPEDCKAAIAALQDGTIDAVATDHAPHTGANKAGGFAGAANGVVGLETAFAVLYTSLVLPGVIALERLLWLLTDGPRGVLGLAPVGIQAGAVADLTLLDLGRNQAIAPQRFYTKGRSTPFAGWRAIGWPVYTLVGGKKAYEAPPIPDASCAL